MQLILAANFEYAELCISFDNIPEAYKLLNQAEEIVGEVIAIICIVLFIDLINNLHTLTC